MRLMHVFLISRIVHYWFFNFFFFKQKTAYEMRISDWSSDVCSSDLMLAKLRVEPGLQRLSIHVSALGQRYERFGHFAMIAVGYTNHQRFADGWMVIENFLDLAREYLEPANSNHVLQPIDDANVAIQIGRASCREREWQDV